MLERQEYVAQQAFTHVLQRQCRHVRAGTGVIWRISVRMDVTSRGIDASTAQSPSSLLACALLRPARSSATGIVEKSVCPTLSPGTGQEADD